MFRPCIDLHEGKVKQIVGSTLSDEESSRPVTNFESQRASWWYASLFREDGLEGGHIVMLGPGNEAAARLALETWPGGMQIGGGLNIDNARSYLDAGATHVIVTSWIFHHGQIDFDRLEALVGRIGKKRLVLDLSCRLRDDRYFVVTDRWQNFTEVEVNEENLARLAGCCDEFLVHAVDVEGKREGVDYRLVELLGKASPIPTTYAGGADSVDDLRKVDDIGGGRIDLTIGSALDIYGGAIRYADVVAYCHEIMNGRVKSEG